MAKDKGSERGPTGWSHVKEGKDGATHRYTHPDNILNATYDRDPHGHTKYRADGSFESSRDSQGNKNSGGK